MAYRKQWSEAIRSGVATEAETLKILEQNDVWSESDNQNIANMLMQLHNKQQHFKVGKEGRSKEDNAKLAKEVVDMRNDITMLFTKKMQLLENTAEGSGNQARISKLMQLCCYKSDEDQPLFKDEDHFIQMSRVEPEAFSAILREAYIYNSSVDNSDDQWEEVKYLQDYEAEQEKELQTVLGESAPKKKKRVTKSRAKKTKVTKKK
jgi:hypothetical protein